MYCSPRAVSANWETSSSCLGTEEVWDNLNLTKVKHETHRNTAQSMWLDRNGISSDKNRSNHKLINNPSQQGKNPSSIMIQSYEITDYLIMERIFWVKYQKLLKSFIFESPIHLNKLIHINLPEHQCSIQPHILLE